MRFPDIELDDRRFQDLVDEARRRIGTRCPEWTDHNVASPGIVLTELFAWMTEMLVFRLNQVPDKLHLRLLELLDVHLRPPRAAETELRFLLAGPPAEPVTIPAHTTEVATRRDGNRQPVVFTTAAPVTIPIARPTAYVLQRFGGARDVGVAAGVVQPVDEDREAFSSPPEPGDALMLGFDEPLAGLVLRVQVECSEAHGAGIKPDEPPLVWEVSAGGGWEPAAVLEDTTGGFNHGGGRIDLQLPRVHDRETIAGQDAHWVRCRVDAPGYRTAPQIEELTAVPVGALVPAVHAELVAGEDLGESDGTPGQTFSVRYAPALALAAGETLEVHEPGDVGWTTWEQRDTFAHSGAQDPHFRFDAAQGELELGPGLRDDAGAWRQHGKVPAKGAFLRLSRYRHGGGARGNVRAETLTELRSAIPGVAEVCNPQAATGGVDGETLDEARLRAALELRVRDRAVTADDFARLAERGSARVARATCVAPRVGEPVRVVVLPRHLPADDALLEEVARHLDERRLLGTTVDVVGPKVRRISVAADVEVAPGSDPERVESDVRTALDRYLDPVDGADGDGWAFGRPLHQGELFGVAQAVAGVRFVHFLRIYEVDPATGKPAEEPAGRHLPLDPDEVVAPAEHTVRARRGG